MVAHAQHRARRKTSPPLAGAGDNEPAPFPATLRILVLSLLLLLSAYTVFAGMRVRRAADAALGAHAPATSLVVQPDGRVLNPEMVAGDAETSGTVEKVFGLSLEQLLNNQKHGHGTLAVMRGQAGQQTVNVTRLQPSGLLHGGASVALAETLGSVAAICCVDRSRHACVGQEINANHLRSARSGVVIGTARPFHIGRRSHVWGIEIRDDAGQLVCVSRITMAVLELPTG